MLDIKQEVFFSSRWYLCAQKSPHALHLASQKLPPTWPLKQFRCSSDLLWPIPIQEILALTYIPGGWGGKGSPLQTPHYHQQRGFMPNTMLPPPDGVYAQHCAIASEGECWWWNQGLSRHPSRFSPQCTVSWVWAKPRCWIPTSVAAPWCWRERVLLDTPVLLSLHCRCMQWLAWCGWVWCMQWLAWCGGVCNDWPGVVVRAVTGPVWWDV